MKERLKKLAQLNDPEATKALQRELERTGALICAEHGPYTLAEQIKRQILAHRIWKELPEKLTKGNDEWAVSGAVRQYVKKFLKAWRGEDIRIEVRVPTPAYDHDGTVEIFVDIETWDSPFAHEKITLETTSKIDYPTRTGISWVGNSGTYRISVSEVAVGTGSMEYSIVGSDGVKYNFVFTCA